MMASHFLEQRELFINTAAKHCTSHKVVVVVTVEVGMCGSEEGHCVLPKICPKAEFSEEQNNIRQAWNLDIYFQKYSFHSVTRA